MVVKRGVGGVAKLSTSDYPYSTSFDFSSNENLVGSSRFPRDKRAEECNRDEIGRT